MGPVGEHTMVQTVRLCDGDGMVGEAVCPGWGSDGGIEQRCTNPVHVTRTVLVNVAVVAAGVSYRKFDYWVRCGHIKVQGKASPGTGRPRHITEHEVAVLRLMAVLVDSGVAPPVAARLARNLWQGEPARLTPDLVVSFQQPEEAAQ